MGIYSFFDNIAFKAGILATGVTFMFLYKKNVYPEVMAPMFYVFTTVGMAAVLQHVLRWTEKSAENGEDGSRGSPERDDPVYEARMAEFKRLTPEFQRIFGKVQQLCIETQRLNKDRDCLTGCVQDSNLDERMEDQQAKGREKQSQPKTGEQAGTKYGDTGESSTTRKVENLEGP